MYLPRPNSLPQGPNLLELPRSMIHLGTESQRWPSLRFQWIWKCRVVRRSATLQQGAPFYPKHKVNEDDLCVAYRECNLLLNR